MEQFGLPDNNVKGYPLGRIGDVVSDVHYGTSAKASDNGKYVYIRMNNITYEGALDLSDIKRIDVADSEIENYIVRYGDVLFNRTNSRDLVGKTCVIVMGSLHKATAATFLICCTCISPQTMRKQ